MKNSHKNLDEFLKQNAPVARESQLLSANNIWQAMQRKRQTNAKGIQFIAAAALVFLTMAGIAHLGQSPSLESVTDTDEILVEILHNLEEDTQLESSELYSDWEDLSVYVANNYQY